MSQWFSVGGSIQQTASRIGFPSLSPAAVVATTGSCAALYHQNRAWTWLLSSGWSWSCDTTQRAAPQSSDSGSYTPQRQTCAEVTALTHLQTVHSQQESSVNNALVEVLDCYWALSCSAVISAQVYQCTLPSSATPTPFTFDQNPRTTVEPFKSHPRKQCLPSVHSSSRRRFWESWAAGWAFKATLARVAPWGGLAGLSEVLADLLVEGRCTWSTGGVMRITRALFHDRSHKKRLDLLTTPLYWIDVLLKKTDWWCSAYQSIAW